MKTTAELAMDVCGLVSRIKERTVASSPDDPDLATSITVMRDDRPICTFLSNPDVNNMMQLAGVAAGGMSADLIAVSAESYHTKLEQNPITERDFERGDLQRLAENFDGIEKGWVTEVLMVTAADRQGNLLIVTMPYKRTGDSVEWLERQVMDSTDTDDEGNPGLKGAVPETLLYIMKQPMMMDHIREMVPDERIIARLTQSIPEKRRQYIQDSAVYSLTKDQEMAMAVLLVAPEEEEDRNLLKEVLVMAGLGELIHNPDELD